jgi:hypothetical protein
MSASRQEHTWWRTIHGNDRTDHIERIYVFLDKSKQMRNVSSSSIKLLAASNQDRAEKHGIARPILDHSAVTLAISPSPHNNMATTVEYQPLSLLKGHAG